jgi:hypothetical protein
VRPGSYKTRHRPSVDFQICSGPRHRSASRCGAHKHASDEIPAGRHLGQGAVGGKRFLFRLSNRAPLVMVDGRGVEMGAWQAITPWN